MDVQAEWDELDNEWPRSDNKRSASTNERKRGGHQPRSARKVQLSPRRSTRAIPGWTSSSQPTGLTQPLIVLEPSGPPIPRKAARSVVNRAEGYATKGVSVKNPDEQEPAESSGEEGSGDDDLQPISVVGSINSALSDKGDMTADFVVSSGQESSKLPEDFSEASDESVEEDLASFIDSEEDSNQRNLPEDSDTEEARSRRLERRRKLQIHESEDKDIGETARNLSYLPVDDVVDLLSGTKEDSSLASTSAIQCGNDDHQTSNQQFAQPIDGHIPVSSSTDPSELSTQKELADIEIQRSRSSSSSNLSPMKQVVTISTSLPSQTLASNRVESFTTGQRNIPDLDVSARASLVSTGSSGKGIPVRKRKMASADSEVARQTSPWKKSKFESEIDDQSGENEDGIIYQEVHQSDDESSLLKSLSRNDLSRSTFIQASQKSISSPSNDDEDAVKASQRASKALQNAIDLEKVHKPFSVRNFKVDYHLPQMSASQPNPVRAKIGRPLPWAKLWETATTEPELEEGQEAQEVLSVEVGLAVEIDFEPLQSILTLRNADYSEAVKSNKIYAGLMQLFISFATSHQTYCGSMDHLFALCFWLINNHEKIEEDDWDDFVLQHQQGEYEAYVNRCLMKFKEPGSWDRWYQQARKQKHTGNVLSMMNVQKILLGEDIGPLENRQPSIPNSWKRFCKLRV